MRQLRESSVSQSERSVRATSPDSGIIPCTSNEIKVFSKPPLCHGHKGPQNRLLFSKHFASPSPSKNQIRHKCRQGEYEKKKEPQ